MLSSDHFSGQQPFTYTTHHLAGLSAMPRDEPLNPDRRRRIIGWVRWKMWELDWKAARVVEATGIDKSALSKMLKRPEEASLGMENFVRLAHGLRLNAHKMLFESPPKIPDARKPKVALEPSNGSDPRP